MLTIPYRRVGRVLIILADQRIYSTRPTVMWAALDAVAQDAKLAARSQTWYNLATIQ